MTSQKNGLILRNNIKEVRAAKRLSQEKLARMVGVSRNTISSIEIGEFCPTAKLAYILCVALEIKFEDLFYLEKSQIAEQDSVAVKFKLKPITDGNT